MSEKTPVLAMVGLATVLTVVFFASPGTPDVQLFLGWVDTMARHGYVRGFAVQNADYPPLSYLVLYGVLELSELGLGSVFAVYKLSLLVFALATSGVLFLWTRDLRLSVLLYLAMVINALALGYIDIYVAPALVAACWCLHVKRFTLFTVAFSIACLTKWQPLVVAPFVLAYLLRCLGVRRFLVEVATPAGTIALLFLAVFGPAIVDAFRHGLVRDSLSAYALNLNWIATVILRRFDGIEQIVNLRFTDEFQHGDILLIRDWRLRLVPVALFGITYGGAWLVFVMRLFTQHVGTGDVLWAAVLGFTSYFMFNIGSCENHLFVPSVLAIVACALAPVSAGAVRWAWFWSIYSNVNLVLFYGFSGSGLVPPERAWILLTVAVSTAGVLGYAAHARWVLFPLGDGGRATRDSLAPALWPHFR